MPVFQVAHTTAINKLLLYAGVTILKSRKIIAESRGATGTKWQELMDSNHSRTVLETGKLPLQQALIFGPEDRIRTGMMLPPAVFETAAYACFATSGHLIRQRFLPGADRQKKQAVALVLLSWRGISCPTKQSM